jgi:hypothetical protein
MNSLSPVSVAFAAVLGAVSGYLFLDVLGAGIGLVVAVAFVALSARDVEDAEQTN